MIAFRGLRGPVLGIDPSLYRTGWALLSPAGKVLQSGSVMSVQNLPTHIRIYSIVHQLTFTVWMKLKQIPDHLAVEYQTVSALPGRKEPDGAPGKPIQNIESALALARLQGAIVQRLQEASSGKIDVMEPKAQEWRRLLGVVVMKGSKEAGLGEIERWLTDSHVDWRGFSEDEKEAIGIARACLLEHCGGYPMHRKREAGKVEKKARRQRKRVRESKQKAAGMQLSLPLEGRK